MNDSRLPDSIYLLFIYLFIHVFIYLFKVYYPAALYYNMLLFEWEKN